MLTSALERHIFLRESRESRSNGISIQSNPAGRLGFHADGNGRERFDICGGGAWMVRIRRLSIRTRNVNSA